MPWPFTISHSWVVRRVGIARILATVSACRKVSPNSTQFIKMMLSTSELTLNSPIITKGDHDAAEKPSRSVSACQTCGPDGAPPTQGVKHGISPVVRKCTAGIDPSPQDGHLRGRQRAALEMMSPSKTAFARPTHSRRQFHNNRKSD